MCQSSRTKAIASAVETALVLLAVPFSLIGAVWLLWLLEYHLSVAVWVGLIALAGLDAQTGVVMLLYLKLAHGQRVADGRLGDRRDLEDAIVEGAAGRLRPKLMTVVAMTEPPCISCRVTPTMAVSAAFFAPLSSWSRITRVTGRPTAALMRFSMNRLSVWSTESV